MTQLVDGDWDWILADSLITRLNKMIEDPAVRLDIERLIEHRIEPVSQATIDHPTLQPYKDARSGRTGLGFLGLLNGLVGVLPEGPRKGWGLITAHYEGTPEQLVRFERTKE